jgi:Protein of unknown function (DUF2874).
MKKIFILLLCSVAVLSCATQKKLSNLVNERDVPERYVKDMTRQRPNVEKKSWQKIDSTTYAVTFTDNDNLTRVTYGNNYTQTAWIVPAEYVPSSITDYIKGNYPSAIVNEVSIVDARNRKTYQATIQPKGSNVKVLEFDINGNFLSEVVNK